MAYVGIFILGVMSGFVGGAMLLYYTTSRGLRDWTPK